MRLISSKKDITPLTDVKTIVEDPTAWFNEPVEVADHPALKYSQKISILRSWELDARRLMLAEEENMGGVDNGETSDLDRVIKALHVLGAGPASVDATL